MYTLVVLRDEIIILREDGSQLVTFRRNDIAHAMETFANPHDASWSS